VGGGKPAGVDCHDQFCFSWLDHMLAHRRLGWE